MSRQVSRKMATRFSFILISHLIARKSPMSLSDLEKLSTANLLEALKDKKNKERIRAKKRRFSFFISLTYKNDLQPIAPATCNL
ncbi:hypothetical protein RP726_05260 [Candidatus Methylospira mobilis]|uniref:hypothetical protein n=1 Tax=Candidatus Methylospira mobilis TaxID=1808979 RepID=UPI0028ED6F44|nr:hypothetical protein [Candidatus Methylospira mobilis]WNV05827.1 hypothetical protein RP726_05260 [Candidatus Methylospira mobilis]